MDCEIFKWFIAIVGYLHETRISSVATASHVRYLRTAMSELEFMSHDLVTKSVLRFSFFGHLCVM